MDFLIIRMFWPLWWVSASPDYLHARCIAAVGTSLHQQFANFGTFQNHLIGLSTCRWLDPSPDSPIQSLVWGLNFAFLISTQKRLKLLVCRPHLWNHWFTLSSIPFLRDCLVRWPWIFMHTHRYAQWSQMWDSSPRLRPTKWRKSMLTLKVGILWKQ